MEGDPAIAAGAVHAKRWAGGVRVLLLLMTFWGAWVFLIGFRPCPLSYLLWR